MSKCCNKVQHKALEEYLQQNIKIKILYETLERILTTKIANINFFLSFLYIKGLNTNMAAITKETYKANGIEVITDKLGKLWLNERRIEKN